MKCPTYTRAAADHAIASARLRQERNPKLRIGFRRAVIEFANEMAAHRNCRCQELRRTA